VPSVYIHKPKAKTACVNCGNTFMTNRKAIYCPKRECQKARKEKNMRDHLSSKYGIVFQEK